MKLLTSLDTVSDGIALVDLWAEWCPACNGLMPTLEALESQYEGKVTFYKVDCDQTPEIPSQLGVRGIPTVLIYSGGVVRHTIVGKRDKSIYEEALNSLTP